jgi:hypothetical protein
VSFLLQLDLVLNKLQPLPLSSDFLASNESFIINVCLEYIFKLFESAGVGHEQVSFLLLYFLLKFVDFEVSEHFIAELFVSDV